MSKNYMKEVATMLGLKLEEEFDIKGFIGNPFRITEEEGLVDKTGAMAKTTLTILLLGEVEIIKKPWKPKEDEIFYFILHNGNVTYTTFSNESFFDIMKVRLGNFFKTRKEAEDNVGKWLEYLNQKPDLSWRVK